MKKLLLILISLSACLYLGFVGSVIGATENHSENEVVVLAHGLGRSDTAMWLFKRRLEDEGFAVCTLDYSSIGETVASVLEVTTKQIDQCVSDAPTVHFVGHSLGGLVSRSYLQHHPELTNSSRLGHVVLMGTPNQGSEIADHYDGSWVMEFGGEISQALVTGENSLGNQLELIDSNIGIIAGTKSMILTNDAFSGPNDGLVSVESTKLSNMKDFIEIEVGHSNMRYNKEVAEQAVHFLKHGQFNH